MALRTQIRPDLDEAPIMYRDFYGLADQPFAITPNPRYIFLSKNHKEVFAHLLYGIRNHCGFIEVCGEVGTGKTTVLRTLLRQLEDDAYRLAFIFNPSLSAPELLRSINREFGIAWEGADNDTLISALNDFLLRENAAGRTVVLVIDEAQNLEPAVLEQIRLLSNLETETDKLIQIVLVGQPELEQVLAQSRLRQLCQRITVRYHLRPMDYEDTCAYITHRLEVAGADATIFTPAAVRRIFRHSGGLPRLINVLCDRSLLVGYAEDSKVVSAAMVATAIRELRREARTASGLRCWWPALLGSGVGLAIAVGLYVAPFGRPVPSPVSVVAEAAAPAQQDEVVSLRSHLVSRDEAETTTAACNAVLALWGGTPSPAGGIEALAKRGLQLTSFVGSLDELIALDTPALVELSIPGVHGRRLLAIEQVVGDRAKVAPAPEGGAWVGLEALRRYWSGRAQLVWRNGLDVPYLAAAGASGVGVSRLQELLHEAGVYRKRSNGVYDQETIAAVRRFQGRRGIARDGLVGPRTLMLLYQDTSAAIPRLTGTVLGGEG